MKKFLTVLLAAVMIFSFCGCRAKPDNNTFYLNITNNTDSKLLGCHLEYAIGGKPLGSGKLVNANEKYLAKGETITQAFDAKDFPDGADISAFSFQCNVILGENKESACQSTVNVKAVYGNEYSYSLTGSEKSGFTLTNTDK